MKFASESSGSPTIRFAKRFANHPVRWQFAPPLRFAPGFPAVCPSLFCCADVARPVFQWYAWRFAWACVLGSLSGFPVVRLAVRRSIWTQFTQLFAPVSQWYAWRFAWACVLGSLSGSPGFPVVRLAVRRSIWTQFTQRFAPVSQWYAWRFAGAFWPFVCSAVRLVSQWYTWWFAGAFGLSSLSGSPRFPSGTPGGSLEHSDLVRSAVRPGFPVVHLAVRRSIWT